MRFIPEYSSVIYSRQQHGKAPQSLSGRWPLENPDLILELEEERENDSPRYRFVVTGKQELFIHSISLTGRLEGTLRPVSILSDGSHSRSFAEILSPSDKQMSVRLLGPQRNSKAGDHESSSLVLLSDGLNPDLMLAQEAPFREFTSFRVHSGRQPVRITLTWQIEREPESNRKYTTGWAGQYSGTGELLLREWSIRNAAKLPAATPQKQRHTVVCCPTMGKPADRNADYILRTLNAAREKQLPFDIILIEEGWQHTIGEWTSPAEHFGEELPRISREIAEAGFTPGLWLAPFVAAKESEISTRPGWLLCNERGKPVEVHRNPRGKRQLFALDITNPEVAEHIAGVIKTLTQEWGFGYLKLEMLDAAALAGKRHNNKCTPAELLNRGLQNIRNAAGDRVHLAGCGLPLLSGAGILDSESVAPKIYPQQKKNLLSKVFNRHSDGEIKRVIQNVILRSHMNRVFWINDACYLSFLQNNSADGDRETEELHEAVILSGGNLCISDDLSLYGDEENARIKQCISEARELSKGCTTPLRLFSDPGVCTVYNEQGYIVIFNLSDTETTIELRLSPYRELLAPYNSYRPFEGAEDHPLEAPRNITLKPGEHKRIRLRSV